ncbi:MAG: hypothetical protein ACK4GT_00695 [Pararhodobacter sp.]
MDDSPVWVEGRGWYESVPAEGEADGLLRVAGQDGRHWRLTGADALKPQWFTRPDDEADAAKALQRACDHARRHGPLRIDLGSARYDCRSRLTLDPTRVVLTGAGAVLDFRAMPEPPVMPPVVTLNQIRPAPEDGSWRRDGEALTHADGPRQALTHPVVLPQFGRYRVTFLVAALSGSSDYPMVRISVSQADRTRLGGILATAPGLHVFEFESTQTALRLEIESDASARIDSLTLDWQGERECVLVQVPRGGAQYGHKPMHGIELVGPGPGTRLHGMRFETLTETLSSRLHMFDVVVRGFQTGFVFSHRSYLVRGYNLRCVCEIGMHFLGGTQDAGELFSFFGSIIGGSRIAIQSNGAEVLLDGTSVNFVDQIFVGSGFLTLQGCHLEINRPTDPARPPFDLAWGNVVMNGGTFIVTGAGFEQGNACDHFFRLRSRAATALLADVSTYNLRTQTGALAEGPGRLDTARLRGRRPRHTAPIVQFAPERNLLGPLPREGRSSATLEGAFDHHPVRQEEVVLSPHVRFAWVCGTAKPGAEVGVSLELMGDSEGEVEMMIHALDGESRSVISNRWRVPVQRDWTRFQANTSDTHPSVPGDGRMPDGWPQVALAINRANYPGRLELRSLFLSAV